MHDLYFAHGRADAGDTIMLPLSAYKHEVRQSYISGAECRYNFNLIHYAMLTEDVNAEDNIDTLLDVEQLAAWVETQNAEGSFPPLDGVTVTAVGVHESDAAHFAAEDAAGMGKYMFQFYIDYLKKE